MRIVKNISLAELVVDPKNGKIWVNSPNCVLRIQGINFKNIKEKFSMIDINGSNASMLEGSLATSEMNDFIEKIISIIISKNYNTQEMESIINKLHKGDKI